MDRINTIHDSKTGGDRTYTAQKPYTEIARFWSDKNKTTEADVDAFKYEVKKQLGIPLETPITCDLRPDSKDDDTFRLACCYTESDNITRVWFLSLSPQGAWKNITPEAHDINAADAHENDVVYYENYQSNYAFFVAVRGSDAPILVSNNIVCIPGIDVDFLHMMVNSGACRVPTPYRVVGTGVCCPSGVWY